MTAEQEIMWMLVEAFGGPETFGRLVCKEWLLMDACPTEIAIDPLRMHWEPDSEQR